jgi:predicted PurR-regulated permease PerM
LRRLLHQQVYLAILIAIALWFLYSAREVLPLFLVAFLLAYVLAPLVQWVAGPEGRRLSRQTAVLVLYLVVIVVLGAALYLLAHALRAEILAYARTYARYRGAFLVNLRLQEAHGLLRSLPGSAKEALNGVVANSNELGSVIARRALPGLVKTTPRLVESVAVPIVAYYLLTDYRRFIAFVQRAVAPRRPERFDALLRDINGALRGYLAGHVTLSAIAGGAAFLILALNGVHPALVVGLAAAIRELIPVVGPLVWVVVAVALTVVQKPEHTLVVAALAILAHQADMHILAPRILGRHLSLHPVVVIFALLAGNAVLGILGVLLAAPLAALVTTTLTYLVREGPLSRVAVIEEDDLVEAGAREVMEGRG